MSGFPFTIFSSMKYPFAALLLIMSILCHSQTLTLELDVEQQGQVDRSLGLIVVHLANLDQYSDLSDYNEIEIGVDADTYRFDVVPTGLTYTQGYAVSTASIDYTLYFTELPLMSIQTREAIVDEPKVLGTLTYADDSLELTAYIGVELRGGSTLTVPKKTLDIEIWQDTLGEISQDVQFGDLRSDDDWVLDALYNEPLRMRSFFAHQLWIDMHSLYFQDKEPNAKSGADVRYVELFLNGHYNGIYALSEQLDRKQMKLKSYKEGVRGELYKGTTWGAPTYGQPPSYNNASREWAGYEMKYPKEDQATDWEAVFDFVDFVNNSSDEIFVEQIWSAFDYDNHLDYFIFLNVLRATDNTGKNIYLAKYNTDEPYFNVPWDLDGCLGTIWSGERENITDDILSNGLINRVIELNPSNYEATVSARWLGYRAGLLSTDNLLTNFQERFDYFTNNKIYEREALVYPNYGFDEESLTYMLGWVQNRMEYLDTYFRQLSSTEESQESRTLLLYPNPVNGSIHLKNHHLYLNKDFQIINDSGQIFIMGKIASDMIAIDTLPPGVYVLMLEGGQSRFVVE
jgi:hypothetical protein